MQRSGQASSKREERKSPPAAQASERVFAAAADMAGVGSCRRVKRRGKRVARRGRRVSGYAARGGKADDRRESRDRTIGVEEEVK